jgi:hypothetical protein
MSACTLPTTAAATRDLILARLARTACGCSALPAEYLVVRAALAPDPAKAGPAYDAWVSRDVEFHLADAHDIDEIVDELAFRIGCGEISGMTRAAGAGDLSPATFVRRRHWLADLFFRLA